MFELKKGFQTNYYHWIKSFFSVFWNENSYGKTTILNNNKIIKIFKGKKHQRRDSQELGTRINKYEKSFKKKSTISESYRIFQATLLIISVFALSYHGLRYGRTEYSLLENGKTANGFLSTPKKVVTVSLGYSVPYSVLSSIAAFMLIFSLISVSYV